MRGLVDRLGNRGGELWAETPSSFIRLTDVLSHSYQSLAKRLSTLRRD
jgi:hypothetical protein